MYRRKKIIAIIPARGGSEGIPRKSVKPLAGRPLIAHAIGTALSSPYLDRVLVSSDDEEILNVSRRHGADAYRRPRELADDRMPLDPVVRDAVKNLREHYDVVITLQPTSPLLTLTTLNAAIKKIVDERRDSVLTLTDRTHLYWKEREGKIVPDFEKRLNRQELSKIYAESGAVIGCTSDYLLATGARINAANCGFVITSPEESIDVDDYHDWHLVERLLQQKKIGINVIGSRSTGLGHVYRQLNVALHLDSKPIFFVRRGENLALAKIRENHYPAATYGDHAELTRELKRHGVRILLNDVLDTDRWFIERIKRAGVKVINFEDLGSGAAAAHATINELYEFSRNEPNIYYGHAYACLRPDVAHSPKKRISRKVKTVLVTCGGVDESNLTELYLEALRDLRFHGRVNVVLGLGNRRGEKLKQKFRRSGLDLNYFQNIPSMADFILGADLVLTSNGRTVYEVVAIGTPAIVMCQNPQEVRHTFSNISGCVANLGLASHVSREALEANLRRYLTDVELRRRQNQRMLAFGLERGIHRVMDIINTI